MGADDTLEGRGTLKALLAHSSAPVGGETGRTRDVGAFRLVNGREFAVEAPAPAEIQPVVLAHSLALINRYAGHTPAPYSVAEHSVRVALLVRPHLRLAALLHDAHEGLGLGDVIGPVKRLLPAAWKALERGIDLAVAERFGIDVAQLSDPAVKRADLVMLRAEQLYLRGHGPHLGEGDASLAREVKERVPQFEPWRWQTARRRYLRALEVEAMARGWDLAPFRPPVDWHTI